MEPATETRFTRMDNSTLGAGETIEWIDAQGQTLAYLDFNEAGDRASVIVFTPYRDGSRQYVEREAGRAMDIAVRHLAKEGYVRP